MTDFPAEVAHTAYDLAKAIIEVPAKFGYMTVEIEGQSCTVVVGFDDASHRLDEMMALALIADDLSDQLPPP